MRLTVSLWLFALPLLAQQAPIGIVRGSLLEWDTGPKGQLTVRDAANQVFCFLYDDKTYFGRGQENITARALRKGDRLEIVADRSPASSLRYARTVQVMEDPPAARRTMASRRLRPYRSPLDSIFPRGNLTFAGVVSRINAERLVLHTRAGGEKSILLRDDTAYFEEGAPAQLSSLKANTRVFIRAGRNLDDELEAYQVVWGHILEPGK